MRNMAQYALVMYTVVFFWFVYRFLIRKMKGIQGLLTEVRLIIHQQQQKQ